MKDNFWNEWRDLLIQEFECRLTAMGTKGNLVTPGRKGLTALFLLVKDPGGSVADILPAAIKTVREKGVKDTHQANNLSFNEDQYDSIAMMGHRIGFLENSDDLERYLQDINQLMKPKGQMLFTSLDMHTIANQRQNLQPGRHPGEIEMQFQYGNLVGPFFGLFHLDTKTFCTHVATTNWQYMVIHQEDDDNYIAWLRHEEW